VTTTAYDCIGWGESTMVCSDRCWVLGAGA
jgi:hypothetical protein